MTPALIREAADRLEGAVVEYTAGMHCNHCEALLRPAFLTLKAEPHKPDCLITRLRSAADQMEKPPEDDITGNMWIAGRAVFVTEADRFAKADRHEIASAIADRAPEKIYLAMIAAVRKTEQEG